jgi:hypothetical protein
VSSVIGSSAGTSARWPKPRYCAAGISVLNPKHAAGAFLVSNGFVDALSISENFPWAHSAQQEDIRLGRSRDACGQQIRVKASVLKRAGAREFELAISNFVHLLEHGVERGGWHQSSLLVSCSIICYHCVPPLRLSQN